MVAFLFFNLCNRKANKLYIRLFPGKQKKKKIYNRYGIAVCYSPVLNTITLYPSTYRVSHEAFTKFQALNLTGYFT
jgi:hypothetical protein